MHAEARQPLAKMIREALLELSNDIAEAQEYLTAIDVQQREIARQDLNPIELKDLSKSRTKQKLALVEAGLQDIEATSLKLQVRHAACNASLTHTQVPLLTVCLCGKMAEKKANDAGNYSMAMSLRSRRADLQRVQETYFKLQASDTCYVVYALLLCRKLE